MIKVNCPNCDVRLTASDDHVGKPVNCQKCNTKFILSKRWMNEPLEMVTDASNRRESASSGVHDSPARNQLTVPLDASSSSNSLSGVEQVSTPALGTSTKPWEEIARQQDSARRYDVRLDGYVEARSLVEFFDFRFRRYLTPWIIRISWPFVLTGATIWVLIVSYTFVSSLIASGDIVVGPDVDSNAIAAIGDSANSKQLFVVTPFFLKTGIFLSSLIAIGLSLLWIRVVFETIMLLFSMSNTLRVIQDHEKHVDARIKRY